MKMTKIATSCLTTAYYDHDSSLSLLAAANNVFEILSLLSTIISSTASFKLYYFKIFQFVNLRTIASFNKTH